MSFPVNGIIDSAVRANENPNSDGGNWSTVPFVPSDAAVFEIVSNQFASIDGNEDSQYWQAQTFGPDCEVYVTNSSNTPNYGAHLRVQNPGSSSFNSYTVFKSSIFLIEKFINNSFTILSNTSVVSGMTAVGLSAIGSTITSYYFKFSAGGWNQKAQVTDSAVSGVGYLGMIANSVSAGGTWGSNFGGGTLASAALKDSFTLTGDFLLQ